MTGHDNKVEILLAAWLGPGTVLCVAVEPHCQPQRPQSRPLETRGRPGGQEVSRLFSKDLSRRETQQSQILHFSFEEELIGLIRYI